MQSKILLLFILIANTVVLGFSARSHASETYCSTDQDLINLPECENYKSLPFLFLDSFYKNSYFIDDTISHGNQIRDYLGLTGWADNNIVEDAKSLWETFQIESSRQTSKIKKYSQDIPNGYNGSLLKY
tara:strand:+ start:136 stop:522 length:387 start_codon:yes stop_codon:yes gene_type:complete